MSNTITGSKATKLLGISHQAFASLIKRNRLKAQKIDRHYTLTHNDLENYIKLRLSELKKETDELADILNYLQ
jgi:hypothetical protein